MKKGNIKGIGVLIVLVTVAIWLMYRSKKAVVVFLASLVLAYLLEPMVKGLQRQGLGRLGAILWVYGVGFFVLSGSITMLWPYLLQEINALLEMIPQYMENIEIWYDKTLYAYEGIFASFISKEEIDMYLAQSKESLGRWVAQSVKNTPHWIGDGVVWLLVPIVSFYLLKDKEKLLEFAEKLLPLRRKNEWYWLFGELDGTIKNFLKGSVLVGTVVAVFTSAGLWIVGVKFSVLFGLIAGVCNIIPYFGPIIGGAPAVIAAFFQQPQKALWAVGVMLVIQQIESHFITPKVMGDKLGLHPLVIMFALLSAGTVFGIWGMVLAVPIAGVIKVVGAFILSESVALRR